MEPNMDPEMESNMEPEMFDYLWYLMEAPVTLPTAETLPELPPHPQPLNIPEFISIADACRNQNRNPYGLLFKQVKRAAALPSSLRIIQKLCERYGWRSSNEIVEPDEVISLDQDIKGHLVNYQSIPAYFNNNKGTQHENVVRYIFGRFFVWFGRKRYALQVLNSKTMRIREENKVTYLRIMSMFVQIVEEMLDTIDQKEMDLQSTSVQERADRYF